MDEFGLGKLVEKVDSALKKLDDIESRLRALEKFKWRVSGAAIIAGASAGGLAKLLG